MPASPELTTGQLVLLVGAAGAVGLALQLNNGCYDPAGLTLLVLALAAVLRAVTVPSGGTLSRLSPRAVEHLLLAVLAIQLATLLTQPIIVTPVAGRAGWWPPRALIALGCVLIAGIAAGGPKWRHRCFVALLLAHGAIGVWVLRHATGRDDVLLFQRSSAAALLHGQNPYAIRFPNIFAPFEGFYGKGVVVHDVLQFGFPYPPLSLLLAVPGAWLGDVRYAHVSAMTLAGAAIGYTQPGRRAFLAAALFLFSPRFGHLLCFAWTEPFVVLTLATSVLCVRRAPRLLPVALGLFLAVKQYQVLAIPALWLVIESRPQRSRLGSFLRLLAKSGAVALAVTLPLAIWNLREFVRSVILLQLKQPFRPDALSFMAAWTRAGGRPSSALAFVLAALAMLVALRTLPRTGAGFAAAIALVYLVFFSFNKQAFCNYYFLVIGACSCAVASAAIPSRPAPDAR